MAIKIEFGGTPAIHDFLLFLAKTGNQSAMVLSDRYAPVKIYRPGAHYTNIVLAPGLKE